jgi:gluconokinase
MPWLLAIGEWLATQEAGAVVTCSALKRRYRDTLRAAAPALVFLHLDGDKETARQRVAGRAGHFMPESLVDSQFADLEPLGADEPGIVVDFARTVDEIVDGVVSELS